MSQLLRTILRHSPAYLSSSMIASIVSILMTKYYTQALSPEDFGTLSLHVALLQYLTPILALNFDAASHRVFFDLPANAQSRLQGTVLVFAFCCCLIYLTIGYLFNGTLKGWTHGSNLSLLLVFMATSLNVLSNYFIRRCQNSFQSREVLRFTIISTFFTHFVAVILISKIGWSYTARFVGISFGLVVALIVSLRRNTIRHLFSIELAFDRQLLKKLRYFALPSLAVSLVGSGLAQVDKIIINKEFGPAKVGIFAVALLLGQGFSLISQSIGQSLSPIILGSVRSDIDTLVKQSKNFDRFFWLSLMIFATILSSLAPIIIDWIADPRYRGSSKSLCLVVFAYAISGMYVLVSEILNYHRIVWFWPLVSISAYGVGALANILLIPSYGLDGAAFSLFSANLVYTLLVHIIGRNYYYPLRFTVPFFGCIWGLGAIYLVN